MPPTSKRSVAPVTTFPTLCNGLFTHPLIYLRNLNESRDLIYVLEAGSQGHSMVPGAQKVLNK